MDIIHIFYDFVPGFDLGCKGYFRNKKYWIPLMIKNDKFDVKCYRSIQFGTFQRFHDILLRRNETLPPAHFSILKFL